MRIIFALIVLPIFIFSCTNLAVKSVVPQPPQVNSNMTQRQIASEEEDFYVKSYANFFYQENYLGRLKKIRVLAHQLHTLMNEKGHPRKRILEKFQMDLDKNLAYLSGLDENISVKDWLPEATTRDYSKKLAALIRVSQSADVMAQLESYLASTKVMEDDTYEVNSFYTLMRKALRELKESLVARTGNSMDPILESRLSYSKFLSEEARLNLHKVFDSKMKAPQKKVASFFKKIESVNSVDQARAILNSRDMILTRSYLAYTESSGSSDIDGIRDDFDTKISTYFGLEMIKFLFSNLN
jgi:hypothetical protein